MRELKIAVTIGAGFALAQAAALSPRAWSDLAAFAVVLTEMALAWCLVCLFDP